MTRWEYHIEHFGAGTEASESFLHRLGREGWELVTVTPTLATELHRFVFKRPLPDPAATRETERAALVAEVGECCNGGDPLCADRCLVECALRKRRQQGAAP